MRRLRKRQIDDPLFDPLRSLRARRTIVLVAYLLLLMGALLAWQGFALAAASIMLLGFATCLVLRRTVRNIDDAPEAILDERLVAARDAAFRTAYTALVAGAFVALFALSLLAEVEERHLNAVMYAFVLGALLLPNAVLAWRERDV